jgi:hypothetical protein
MRPVAQKVHAIAQPAWVETQTESRFAPSGDVAGIATVSISWPSANLTSRLRVPSLETAWTTRSHEVAGLETKPLGEGGPEPGRQVRDLVPGADQSTVERAEQLFRAVGGLAKLRDDRLERRQIQVEDARQRRRSADGHGIVRQVQEGQGLGHTPEVCGRFR